CALAMLGLAFYVGSLSVGGILQGLALNDPQVPFAGALNRPLLCFRVGTLGDLLMAAGNVCLALNLAWLLARCCRECCVPATRSGRVPFARLRGLPQSADWPDRTDLRRGPDRRRHQPKRGR